MLFFFNFKFCKDSLFKIFFFFVVLKSKLSLKKLLLLLLLIICNSSLLKELFTSYFETGKILHSELFLEKFEVKSNKLPFLFLSSVMKKSDFLNLL